MTKKLAAPYIAEAERSLAVMKLLAWGEGLVEIIHRLQEQGLHLKDEVAVLKGERKRPKFKPSRMHEDAGKAGKPDRAQNGKPARRAGSAKKSKTGQLKIDYEEVIQPVEPIAPASRFKGYRDFVAQDLKITSHNTRYRLARWQTPDGRTIGNEHFAWFKSRLSKSRINFLELLGAGHSDYQINDDALAYMKKQGLPQAFMDALREHEVAIHPDQDAWHAHLARLGMHVERHPARLSPRAPCWAV